MNMNETTTKRKERYEAPEVLDIKPVTTCIIEGINESGGFDDEE